MTKRELALRIAAEMNMIQSDVTVVIQKILDYIVESLANGENVEFRDFGVFQLRIRKARPGRNPKKPEQKVIIPSRRAVKFKMGRVMKERMKAAEEIKG